MLKLAENYQQMLFIRDSPMLETYNIKSNRNNLDETMTRCVKLFIFRFRTIE